MTDKSRDIELRKRRIAIAKAVLRSRIKKKAPNLKYDTQSPWDTPQGAALRTQNLAIAKAYIDKKAAQAARDPKAHARQEALDKARLDLVRKKLVRAKRRREFVDGVAFVVGLLLVCVITMVVWSVADQKSYLKFVCGLGLPMFDCTDATPGPDDGSDGPDDGSEGSDGPGDGSSGDDKNKKKCRPTNDDVALRMTQQVGTLAGMLLIMALGSLMARVKFGERLITSYLRFAVPGGALAAVIGVWVAMNMTVWVLCPGSEFEDVPSGEDIAAGVATLVLGMGLIWFWRRLAKKATEVFEVSGDFPPGFMKVMREGQAAVDKQLPPELRSGATGPYDPVNNPILVPVNIDEIPNPAVRGLVRELAARYGEKTVDNVADIPKGPAAVVGGDIDRQARKMQDTPEKDRDQTHFIVQAMFKRSATVQDGVVVTDPHNRSIALIRRTVSSSVIGTADPERVGNLVSDLDVFLPMKGRDKLKRAESVEELEEMVDKARDRLAANLGFVEADGGYLFHGIERDSDIAIEEQFVRIRETLIGQARNCQVMLSVLARNAPEVSDNLRTIGHLFRIGMTQGDALALTNAAKHAEKLGRELVEGAKREPKNTVKRDTWLRIANTLAGIRANSAMSKEIAMKFAEWKEERLHNPNTHDMGFELFNDATQIFSGDHRGKEEQEVFEIATGRLAMIADYAGAVQDRQMSLDELVLSTRGGRLYNRIANAAENTVIPGAILGRPLPRRFARATVASVGIFNALFVFMLGVAAVGNLTHSAFRSHPWAHDSVIFNVQGVHHNVSPYTIHMHNLFLSTSFQNQIDSIGHLDIIHRNPAYTATLLQALTNTGVTQTAMSMAARFDHAMHTVPSNINFGTPDAIAAEPGGVVVAVVGAALTPNKPTSRALNGLQTTLNGAYWGGPAIDAAVAVQHVENGMVGMEAIQQLKDISRSVLQNLKAGMSMARATDLLCQYVVVDNANTIVKAFGVESQGDASLAIRAACKSGIIALGSRGLMAALSQSNPVTVIASTVILGFELKKAKATAEGVLVRTLHFTGLAEQIGYITRQVDQNNIRNAILGVVEHHRAALETIDIDDLVHQAMNRMVTIESITGEPVDSTKFAKALRTSIDDLPLTGRASMFKKAYRRDLDEYQLKLVEEAGNIRSRAKGWTTRWFGLPGIDDVVENDQFVRYELPGGHYGLVSKEQAKAYLVGWTIDAMGDIMEEQAKQAVQDAARFAVLRPIMDALFGKINKRAEITKEDFESMSSLVTIAANNINAKFQAMEDRLESQGSDYTLEISELAEIRRKIGKFPDAMKQIERKHYYDSHGVDEAIKRDSMSLLEDMQKVIKEGEEHFKAATEKLSFLNMVQFKTEKATELVIEGVQGLWNQAATAAENLGLIK